MRTPPRPVEPWSRMVRLDEGSRTPQEFELSPDAETRAALAGRLDVLGLKKLRFSGVLSPEGKRDWQLEAKLGATVSQACVVTLKPVSTRIDETVERRYVAEMPDLPEADEVEMPDDSMEPLPSTLDLGAVMAEALALALPAWPRADGVEPVAEVFAEPGTKPLRDEDTRPFAGLKGLLRDDGQES
jgi:uncharacterized metal-binding protein YceD (DUF177 family)